MLNTTGKIWTMAFIVVLLSASIVNTFVRHNDVAGWVGLIKNLSATSILILAGFGIAYLTGHQRNQK